MALSLLPGEVYGETRAQDGLEGRSLLRELCGALHRHQPVYPEQTGTDPEEPGLILRDHDRLRRAADGTQRARPRPAPWRCRSPPPNRSPDVAELPPELWETNGVVTLDASACNRPRFPACCDVGSDSKTARSPNASAAVGEDGGVRDAERKDFIMRLWFKAGPTVF